MAEHIVLTNLKTEKAVAYIRQLASGGGGQIGLFAGQVALDLDEQNFRLAFRNAFDHAANDAVGYFARVLLYLSRFATKERRVEMTEKIADILGALVASANEFEEMFAKADPNMARLIFSTRTRCHKNPS